MTQISLKSTSALQQANRTALRRCFHPVGVQPLALDNIANRVGYDPHSHHQIDADKSLFQCACAQVLFFRAIRSQSRKVWSTRFRESG